MVENGKIWCGVALNLIYFSEAPKAPAPCATGKPALHGSVEHPNLDTNWTPGDSAQLVD